MYMFYDDDNDNGNDNDDIDKTINHICYHNVQEKISYHDCCTVLWYMEKQSAQKCTHICMHGDTHWSTLYVTVIR